MRIENWTRKATAAHVSLAAAFATCVADTNNRVSWHDMKKNRKYVDVSLNRRLLLERLQNLLFNAPKGRTGDVGSSYCETSTAARTGPSGVVLQSSVRQVGRLAATLSARCRRVI